MNCVVGLVPEFPVSPHPPHAEACQVALPVASEVSTYPVVGLVVTRSPVNEPVPATSSLYEGDETPIPTLAPTHPRMIAPL